MLHAILLPLSRDGAMRMIDCNSPAVERLRDHTTSPTAELELGANVLLSSDSEIFQFYHIALSVIIPKKPPLIFPSVSSFIALMCLTTSSLHNKHLLNQFTPLHLYHHYSNPGHQCPLPQTLPLQ